MNWTRLRTTLAISVFLLFSASVSRSQESTKRNESNGNAADEAAIKKTFAEFDEAFNHHDAAAVSMTFANDADFTNMRGNHRRGNKGVEEWLSPLFTSTLKSAQRTDTVKLVRFFSPQVASVDADSLITGTKSADGSDVPPRKGLMVTIVTKENGKWRISVFHEVEFPPAPVAVPKS